MVLLGGRHLPTPFHSGSKVSKPNRDRCPCPTTTLALSLTGLGEPDHPENHSTISLEPDRRNATSQERLAQVSLAEKVAGNGGGTRHQKHPFPRTPALSISHLPHPRGAVLRKTVPSPIPHQQQLSGALGAPAGGSWLQGIKSKSITATFTAAKGRHNPRVHRWMNR